MTLEEIRKEKAQLEWDLHEMIEARVSQYQRDTRTAVEGVHVSVMSMQIIGDVIPSNTVTAVHVSVNTGV